MVIALAFTFVATGCKKKPTGVTALPKYGENPIRDPGADQGGKLNTSDTPGGDPLPDLGGDLEGKYTFERDTLRPHMVQFAYDSAAIRSSERPKVDAVAAFMKSAPSNVALLVEGHCDERGTEEYNRALGERRALALREALIGAGADGSRITTRSYGKDRKIDLADTDAAHARNRRGEFVVLTPK